MDIFESLENLPVSEECFDEIMGIVEELLSESNPKTIGASTKKRYDNYTGALKNLKDTVKAGKDPYDAMINYANASNKLERNVELANKHYDRKGDKKESPFKMKDLQDRNKIAKALDHKAAAASTDALWAKGNADPKATKEAEKWENRADRYMKKTNTVPRDYKELIRRVRDFKN